VAVTPLSLFIATSRLNSHIHTRGSSAHEMWTQRDQVSNNQFPLTDRQLMKEQRDQRTSNHRYSEKSKAPVGRTPQPAQIEVGDLVDLHTDCNKPRACDLYLVVLVVVSWCNIHKFTSSHLRSTSYRIKKSECYTVLPCSYSVCPHPQKRTGDGSSDESYRHHQQPPRAPDPPHIPCQLSAPIIVDESTTRASDPFPADAAKPFLHVLTRLKWPLRLVDRTRWTLLWLRDTLLIYVIHPCSFNDYQLDF